MISANSFFESHVVCTDAVPTEQAVDAAVAPTDSADGRHRHAPFTDRTIRALSPKNTPVDLRDGEPTRLGTHGPPRAAASSSRFDIAFGAGSAGCCSGGTRQ